MREIVFDTETTGLDPDQGDRIVEIGCVEMVNRVLTGRTFHAYFNPGRPMPLGAEAVHGLTDAFLADKPPFADRCEELLAFLADCPLVAHNAQFDFAFLNAELGLCRRDVLCRTRMVDTVALAKARHPGAKLSLDAMCTRFGIDRSHRVRHGALLDAELLAQVYVELTGGRQIGLDLASLVATGPAPVARLVAASRPVRPARPHAASAAELARHAEFVATLASPLWAATR